MSKKIVFLLMVLCINGIAYGGFPIEAVNGLNCTKAYADEDKANEKNGKDTGENEIDYKKIENTIKNQEENPSDIQLKKLRFNRDIDIDFNSNKYKYIVNVPEYNEDILINAEPNYRKDTVYINGIQITEEDSFRTIINLDYGKNIVKIEVHDSESSKITEYYLFIYRGGNKYITLNNILMDNTQIGFDSQKNMYNLELDEDDSTIRLEMFPKDSNTEIKVNNTKLNSTNAIKLNFEGINKYTINITLTDIDSKMENTYIINIYLGIPVTPEVQSAIDDVIKPNQWVIENGRWRFNDSYGNHIKDQWIYDSKYKAYFYLNKRGYMVTGWFDMENGDRYYFNSSGARQTGWLHYEDEWYYLNMNGVMEKGWIYDKGKWYYLNEDGVMQCGWVYDKGNWYYLNSDGSMKTGWIIYKKQYYYLTDKGNAFMGWLNFNNNWYYMKHGTGEMVTGQWIMYNGNWYYLNYDGTMRVGWLYKNGKYYYFDEYGKMNTKDKKIDGYFYHFNSDGSADI